MRNFYESAPTSQLVAQVLGDAALLRSKKHPEEREKLEQLLSINQLERDRDYMAEILFDYWDVVFHAVRDYGQKQYALEIRKQNQLALWSELFARHSIPEAGPLLGVKPLDQRNLVIALVEQIFIGDMEAFMNET